MAVREPARLIRIGYWRPAEDAGDGGSRGADGSRGIDGSRGADRPKGADDSRGADGSRGIDGSRGADEPKGADDSRGADDGWPDPRAFIDEDWDEDEREAVSDYLSAGFMFRAYFGFAPCRICGRPNGSMEFTDGVYAWPEGLAHYVDIHAVRLPERFVRHVVGQFDAWDEAVVDEEWWRSFA